MLTESLKEYKEKASKSKIVQSSSNIGLSKTTHSSSEEIWKSFWIPIGHNSQSHIKFVATKGGQKK